MKLILTNCNNYSKNYDYHLWYGGTVVSLETNLGTYYLNAVGEVRCQLYAKKDFKDSLGNEYKKDELIVNIVDKNNDGLFKKELQRYIKNDKHLDKILNFKDKKLKLELGNSNWLELKFLDNKGNNDYSYVLDTDSVMEAIETLLELAKDEQEQLMKDAIYTRSATADENIIKKQEFVCKSASKKEQDISIYADNGFPSFDDYPPVLKTLLEEIKENKVDNVIVESVGRITRDVSKILEISELLDTTNSDILLVKEDMFLNKDFLKNIDFNKISKIIVTNKNYENIEIGRE